MYPPPPFLVFLGLCATGNKSGATGNKSGATGNKSGATGNKSGPTLRSVATNYYIY